ncbi:hypothetical protein, partial [Burkholderia pseudomallei]|uniref:hypothetical protein n=1 Tax=Burkholderia pseudomallei TaxID=28450 RepID=UPI001C4B8680
ATRAPSLQLLGRSPFSPLFADAEPLPFSSRSEIDVRDKHAAGASDAPRDRQCGLFPSRLRRRSHSIAWLDLRGSIATKMSVS